MPISLDEMSYTLELDTTGVPDDDKEQALETAGQVILNRITEYLNGQNSPVSGGSYKKGLSKDYKKRKVASGGRGIANLQFTDAMLSNLQIDTTKSSIKFELTEELQIKKGYAHNVGDDLPQREWLPDDSSGGEFKKRILDEAKEAINQFKRSSNTRFTAEETDALRQFLEGL